MRRNLNCMPKVIRILSLLWFESQPCSESGFGGFFSEVGLVFVCLMKHTNRECWRVVTGQAQSFWRCSSSHPCQCWVERRESMDKSYCVFILCFLCLELYLGSWPCSMFNELNKRTYLILWKSFRYEARFRQIIFPFSLLCI